MKMWLTRDEAEVCFWVGDEPPKIDGDGYWCSAQTMPDVLIDTSALIDIKPGEIKELVFKE